jgi:hypothetical protein
VGVAGGDEPGCRHDPAPSPPGGRDAAAWAATDPAGTVGRHRGPDPSVTGVAAWATPSDRAPPSGRSFGGWDQPPAWCPIRDRQGAPGSWTHPARPPGRVVVALVAGLWGPLSSSPRLMGSRSGCWSKTSSAPPTHTLARVCPSTARQPSRVRCGPSSLFLRFQGGPRPARPTSWPRLRSDPAKAPSLAST